MTKRFLFLFLLLALLLAGCQQQPPGGMAGTSQPDVTSAPASPTAASTSQPAATQAQPEPSEAAVVQAQASCTADSARPTPGPTEEFLFPPVTEADWVMGKPDARVTILEYSDFQ